MTYFAPAAVSCFRFALVRVSAIDFAPTELAIWIAASPTLLDAPGMTTASCEVIFASSISAPYAVINIIQVEQGTWSRVGLREQDCDYRSRMIAETYSTVGRSLPLTWLNVWEKYGERLGGDWGEEGFAMGVLLQQQP